MFAVIKVDTADVYVMWVAFEQADVDGSGELTIGESLNYFGLDYTPFARRVFALMDDDHSVRAPRRLARAASLLAPCLLPSRSCSDILARPALSPRAGHGQLRGVRGVPALV